MLRRNLGASFAAGAHVFPGGSVDDGRQRPGVRGAVPRSDRRRGQRHPRPAADGGLSFWVAAVRECFEEAGVVLAYPGGDGVRAVRRARAVGPARHVGPGDAARFAAYRDELNAGTARFLEVCRAEGLELATDALHYVGRWITPGFMPKRFDTRFFVCAAPPGQVAVHDDGETIATVWMRPADALDRSRRGELDLLPPTIANLGTVGRFATTAELLDCGGHHDRDAGHGGGRGDRGGEFRSSAPATRATRRPWPDMVADAG